VSGRAETWLWLAQRLSAVVLAVAVTVHLATMVYAVRGGLDAAEVVTRVGGSAAWLTFYAVFVGAAAVHAPIGLRTVLAEMTALPRRLVDVVAVAAAVAIAGLGWRAAIVLHGAAGA
jgi:fumarate reductase subunit C